MKFALIFVTLSTIALAKAFFPGPFRVCEDEVSGFVCPNGQEPFPYGGEECSRIRSGADLARPRDLIGRNPCKGLSEVKKFRQIREKLFIVHEFLFIAFLTLYN